MAWRVLVGARHRLTRLGQRLAACRVGGMCGKPNIAAPHHQEQHHVHMSLQTDRQLRAQQHLHICLQRAEADRPSMRLHRHVDENQKHYTQQ